ncbi:Blue copper protein [Carex littledalei]|uniref:Blue copper protein n=1 Tax=Carex littledalei TaxID=544730 RepID=A0A833QEK2_9POAL|nr:Blue copper protein [Carex littledalei]
MVCQSSLALSFLLLISCVSWSSADSNGANGTSGGLYIFDWATGVDYKAWASGKTFQVGNTLVFSYATRNHTVDEVSSADYSSCSSSNALSTDNSGSTSITLKMAGTHYFICGIPSHCSGGMKLAVTVTGSPSDPNGAPGTNSASMSIGSIRDMAVIGLFGLVCFVLGVF